MSRTTRAGWSKERPDSPGYWYWRIASDTKPHIIEVFDSLSARSMSGTVDNVDQLQDGEWQPVQPPRD